MGILDWLNRNAAGIGAVVAVLGALGGLYVYLRHGRKGEAPPTGGGTTSRVTVKNSPGAKAAGRDLGVTRIRQESTDTTVAVEDSKGAEAAGRDLKR